MTNVKMVLSEGAAASRKEEEIVRLQIFTAEIQDAVSTAMASNVVSATVTPHTMIPIVRH